MSDLNDIIDYKKGRATLQTLIKVVLYNKHKEDIKKDIEKNIDKKKEWKFLSLDNEHWNYPVKDNIVTGDYDTIIENIAKKLILGSKHKQLLISIRNYYNIN